jgi:hypothetical protein
MLATDKVSVFFPPITTSIWMVTLSGLPVSTFPEPEFVPHPLRKVRNPTSKRQDKSVKRGFINITAF